MTGWPTGWELAGGVGAGSNIAWQVMEGLCTRCALEMARSTGKRRRHAVCSMGKRGRLGCQGRDSSKWGGLHGKQLMTCCALVFTCME